MQPTARNARRWSARIVALTVVFAAVLLLPRIPLGVAMPGRRLDLRVEDVLLVILSVVWFGSLLRAGARVYLTPLFKWLALYVGLAAVASYVGVVVLGVNPLKSMLYLGKEVEYFLLFFLVANWVRSEEDVRTCTRSIVFLGGLNAVWVVVQAVTGRKETLLSAERDLPTGVYEARLSESYGPNLIGEASPLATGGVFMVLLLLCFCLATVEPRRVWRHVLLAASVLFLVCLLLSFSRTSIAAALVGGVALLLYRSRRFNVPVGAFVVLTVCGVALLLNKVTFLSGKLEKDDMSYRLKGEAIESGVTERTRDIWQPLFERALDHPVLGHGKAAIGSVEGLGAGEAHNHYLRVFAEMGFLGLGAFLALLGALLLVSRGVMLNSSFPEGRALGAATLGTTLALAAGAMFQDIFVPAILNELWWILVGLMAAAHRLQLRRAASTGEAARGTLQGGAVGSVG